MKKIICISGKQYCGKDTLAKILLSELKNFKRVAIADAIKIEFGKRNNLTYDEIEANKGKYRGGLIELGNKGRAVHPDFWLNKLIEMKENIIVPDVRLVHEAKIFKEHNAFLIRIEADYNVRAKRGVITNSADTTETALDNYAGFDYILKNESDIEELKKAALPLIEILNKL